MPVGESCEVMPASSQIKPPKQVNMQPNCNSSSPEPPVGLWDKPIVIAPSNFINKSLSDWACNIAVGCAHQCSVCYVPSVSTNKMGPSLKNKGVEDPSLEWGDYVFLRPWDEKQFLASLRKAEERKVLSRDGNRAVLFCSTTDPYQIIRHPVASQADLLNTIRRELVRKALIAIRDHSTLRVRILTRGPLARQDFEIFQSFGKRLTFGMSLPTLNNRLSRIYEPHAPAPTKRLKTLQEAKEAGLHVFVAMAPTYPESDELDLRNTMAAIAALEPITLFHEVVNVRADNISRTVINAGLNGKKPDVAAFQTRTLWMEYALDTFATVERLAKELKLTRRLHLWPDKSMAAARSMNRVWNPESHHQWLVRWWNRVSEWPR